MVDLDSGDLLGSITTVMALCVDEFSDLQGKGLTVQMAFPTEISYSLLVERPHRGLVTTDTRLSMSSLSFLELHAS